jgi:hypothetical protein
MPDVVTLLQTPGDFVVLVEERWKYKKDLTGVLGVKHSYIVTTTQGGSRKRWDKVLSSPPTRCFDYSLSSGTESYLHRRTMVPPTISEDDLARMAEAKSYDFLSSNCQHYSDELYCYLTSSSSKPVSSWMVNSARFATKLLPQGLVESVQQNLHRWWALAGA